MVLRYPGGIFLPARATEQESVRIVAHPHTVTPAELEEVYLRLDGESYTLACREDEPVQAGTLLATLSDGTPIYASIPGTFAGVFENRSSHYAKIVSAGAEADTTCLQARPPEQNRLADMSREELLEATKTLGIWDIYSGDWLWRRVQKAHRTETRRVVIDLTDADGWSLTGCRAALRAPGEVLNGAKVLLQLLGATKILLIVDRMQRKQADVFRALINDPSLVVLGEVEAKFPLWEETLYEAIYARRLPRGKSAQDEGIFIVRAQTAEALYRALLTGEPQTARWLTAAGDGFGKDLVVKTPFGTPWRFLLQVCKFKGGAYVTRLGSPLHGEAAEGILDGSTECVFSSLPVKRRPGHCISCGRCAEVCPMRLQPFRILRERNYRSVKALASVCFDCGCCDFVCPAALPLREQIVKHRKPPANV
ncbi:MAG: 4Fe-4S binding protein [Oscillospiraceae bacterium]|nr:4Fe-4S binding protein [Oscillospiraceae bacterium]